MGFLDRKSRIIDIALTERGRQLLSEGKLDFVYYAFFDDGVDYDPWAVSGSQADVEEQIHSSPMLEAITVPITAEGLCEPQSPVFTAVDGYSTVPRLLSPTAGSQGTLRCDQRYLDGLYSRSSTSTATILLQHSSEAIPGGFSIHVFASGSNGLQELSPRFDLQERRAIDPFVGIAVDEEPAGKEGRSDSARRGGRK